MVTIQKVQSGLTRFVDTELIPNLSGWDKVLIGGACGLLASNLPKIVAGYASDPMICALGIYDPDTQTIDIDKAYQAILPYLGAEQFPIKIPKVGITIKVGKNEIDRLYKCIKEA